MKKNGIIFITLFIIIVGYGLIQRSISNSYFSINTYKKNLIKYGLGSISVDDKDIVLLLKKTYKNKGNKLYYANKLMTGVSARGFTLLDPFGIDLQGSVYLYGEILKGIDGKSVKFYKHNPFYISDKTGNYSINGNIVSKINSIGIFSTFTGDIHQNFARDSNHLYNYGKIVSGANPDDIILFPDSFIYFISSGNVFFYYDIITGADINTFSPILAGNNGELLYAKDKNNYYFKGQILTGIELETYLEKIK